MLNKILIAAAIIAPFLVFYISSVVIKKKNRRKVAYHQTIFDQLTFVSDSSSILSVLK
jgi:hypothetical protein